MKAILSSVSLSLMHTYTHHTHHTHTHTHHTHMHTQHTLTGTLPHTLYTYTTHTDTHTIHTHHTHILMGNGGRNMTEIHYSVHEIVKK